MNRLAALLVLILGVCAGPARAALVYDGYATGPGGLSTPYPAINPEVYAGLIEFHYNGDTLLTMSDDHANRANVGETWEVHLYSYAEVLAGAPVRFTPAQYARAAMVFNNIFNPIMLSHFSLSLRQVAEMSGNDTLAGLNTQVWDMMSSTSCPVYWPGCESFDTFNWSTLMAVASGGPGRDEYLVPLASQGLTLASGTVSIGPVVPLPPAAWLLGSGLIALVGISRRKK